MAFAIAPRADGEPPALPTNARPVLNEHWDDGKIDPARWYVLRKKWGAGNHGVVRENVFVAEDRVDGRERSVLVCRAHGDRYDGPIVGVDGEKTRVGGVLVSKEFFASGRFEIVAKIGSISATPGGPDEPARPVGAVPAMWTYAYRYVEASEGHDKTQFDPKRPLYNPHMPAYGSAANEYWSELDFPEFGKGGDLTTGLYNTFLQNRHDPRTFDVSSAIDAEYHTFVTDWRTRLQPLPGVRDDQVVEHAGYWWVADKQVPFEDYLGNPLKRLGPDRYAVYCGGRATHWIDGKKVGENDRFVPSMAAQLNLGIWLPEWAGPAPWNESSVSFASIRVWQFDDEGDVRGILTDDIASADD
ncbi:MAG TPA: glycoside hydrolase family 16 protein [Pirellulaceae bacterium]|nr:glycoside hydrolase family 16 protein [Pirellulaceae bacterium]